MLLWLRLPNISRHQVRFFWTIIFEWSSIRLMRVARLCRGNCFQVLKRFSGCYFSYFILFCFVRGGGWNLLQTGISQLSLIKYFARPNWIEVLLESFQDNVLRNLLARISFDMNGSINYVKGSSFLNYLIGSNFSFFFFFFELHNFFIFT